MSEYLRDGHLELVCELFYLVCAGCDVLLCAREQSLLVCERLREHVEQSGSESVCSSTLFVEREAERVPVVEEVVCEVEKAALDDVQCALQHSG